MKARRASRGGSRASPAFDADAFLASSGTVKTIAEYGRGETIFTQGDASEHVLYIRAGGVKLSVQSKTGREAVVALLGPGDFLGEECLAGQPSRRGGATAITPSAIDCSSANRKWSGCCACSPSCRTASSFTCCRATSGWKRTCSTSCSTRAKKRLARALLLLARYGKQDQPTRTVPRISQATLAKMVGTTRSRVNFFLNKFKRQGFIDYEGDMPLKINNSLLCVVLHD